MHVGKKKIIIIGASSGIGKEMAIQLASADNQVAITGRRKELLEKTKEAFPDNIITSDFDITKDNNPGELEALVTRLGGLDWLVISAGTGEVAEQLDREIDKLTIDTNVVGFAEIANWGFNYFVRRGAGQLAVISSVAATRGSGLAPAYNASKAFQSVYSEGLSIKAFKSGKNITVTCIEPGFVDTKMAKSDKKFWVVPVQKAARQMIRAIAKKKRKVFVSPRWWIIAKILKRLPFRILRRIG